MHSQTNQADHGLRRKLLGTASALALIGLCQFPGAARAGDGGDSDFKLTLDIAGQFAMNSGGRTVYGDPFEPPPDIGVKNGGEGLVALNLEHDDWIYGLSFNFGRTGTSHAGFSYYTGNLYTHYSGSGQVRHNESHKVLDFTIGRDVGLGMLVMEGSSVVSVGIEWANFSATTIGDFAYASKYDGGYYNTNFTRVLRRRFNGIGPVISWNASTPLGDPGSHLSLNWGAMASVLFGPRKFSGNDGAFVLTPRSKSATVPRASGYVGVGWHPDDSPFAISAGYAVSATWGVFDGNFDDDGDEIRNSVNRFSHGPYVDLTIQVH